MSQQDFDITTADANTGTTMRAAINAAFQALASTNAGATAPGTTYAYQLWADSTSGFMKIRNAANNGWVQLFPLAIAFSATAVANAVAVRNASGGFTGDVTGNATTATSAGSSTTAALAGDASGTGTIPLARYENGLRIIRGSINNNGTVGEGSGFTVSKSSTGVYVITWSNAFSAIPTVTANVAGFGSTYKGFVVVGTPGTTTTTVYVWDHTGAALDAPVHFTAIGPN